MKTLLAFLFAALSFTASAQAPFKWIDAQGRVTYSDRPPPPGEKVTEVDITGAGLAQSDLSFNLRETVAKSPVTLYTAKGCAPCDDARKLLKARNVPYSEKTLEAEADLKAMQAIFATNTVPAATLGSKQLQGFNESAWVQALEGAGYSKDAKLPKGFETGKTERAGSNQANLAANSDTAKPAANETSRVRRTPPAPVSNEPTVRF